MTQKTATLNRPVVTQRLFDSSALSVLTTLFHRFTEAGTYDVKVRIVSGTGKLASDTVVRRLRVQVGDGGQDQTNVDLAKPRQRARNNKQDDVSEYRLRLDGVMGFYVSRSTERYAVEISQLGEKSKHTVLDSTKAIPAGDLFAVTLVRPGAYRVTNELSKTKQKDSATVEVVLPKQEYGARHDTGKATLIEIGPKGVIAQKKIALQSGQSLVFMPDTDALLRIELEKDTSGNDERKSRSGGSRDKFRYRKPQVDGIEKAN